MSSVGKPRKTHGKELKDLGRIFSPLAGDTWRALSPTNRQLRIKRARVIPIRNAWKDPWYFTMWNFGCLTKTQLVLGGLNMSPMRFVYTLDLLNEAWLRQFLTSDSAALCSVSLWSLAHCLRSCLPWRLEPSCGQGNWDRPPSPILYYYFRRQHCIPECSVRGCWPREQIQ